jgi:hypothetical protein
MFIFHSINNFGLLNSNDTNDHELPGHMEIVSPDAKLTKVDEPSTQIQSPTYTRAREQVNNSPPYFLIFDVPDIELKEDFGEYTLNFSGYADDNEDPADSLRWFITGDNKSLISVNHENMTDQQIILKSITNAYGETTVKLWVSDTTGLMVYQIFSIMIKPINDCPTISNLPVLKIHRGEPYTINLRPYLVDYDTDISKININVEPNENDRNYASVNNHNLDLDFKSTTDFIKNYITLELSDKINKSSYKVQINLTDNYPPKLTKNIPDITIYSGETLINILDLDYFFNDPDDTKQSLSYEYFLNDHLNLKLNDDNSVDLAHIDNWSGTEQIIFRCKDPLGAFKEQSVNVNILPWNPLVNLESLPDLTVHFNQEYSFNLTPYLYYESSSLEPYFEPYEFHENKWIKSSEMSNIKFDGSNNLIMKINYSKEFINKTIPVSIHVTDGESSAFQEFRITVSDDFPPVLKKSLPDLAIDEDQINSSVVDLYEHFSDIENGNLEFTNSGSNVILEIQLNGLVDISSTSNWFGEELVVIRAIDVEGAIIEDSFLVTVRPINDPPTISPFPQINLTQGEKNTFEYLKYLSDVDNDISELSIEVDNKHLTVAGSFLILNYPSDSNGDKQFLLTVTDGELTTKREVNVTILQKDTGGKTEENLIPPTVFWAITAILLIMIIILLSMGLLYVKRLKSFRFNEIYLIYKDGLLIAHVLRGKKSRQDSDIFSGMFTAVQDFIHDSFQNANSTPDSWPLKRMDFGDLKIVIDRGEYVYIAAVFEGYPVRKMLLKLEKLTKDIEQKFVDVLPTWSGDMAQLKGTEKLIKELLLSAGGPTTQEPVQDETPVDEFELSEGKKKRIVKKPKEKNMDQINQRTR